MSASALTGSAFIRQVTVLQDALDRARNEALEQAARHVEESVGVKVGYGLRVISAPELAAELRGMKRGGA